MIYGYDLQIFHWLNSWAFWDPRIDGAVVYFADGFLYFVVASLIVFGVFSLLPIFPRAYRAVKKNWEMIFLALLAAGIARLGVVEAIRLFFHRVRPFEALPNVSQLLAHDREWSFPSGHATFFFAIAAVVGRYYPKTSIFFYLAAALISISRVIAGIHWPSDIIAGAIIGISTGIILIFLARRLFPRAFVGG